MKLLSISLQNILSFRRFQHSLHIHERGNRAFILGTNSSGKSNVVTSVRLVIECFPRVIKQSTFEDWWGKVPETSQPTDYGLHSSLVSIIFRLTNSVDQYCITKIFKHHLRDLINNDKLYIAESLKASFQNESYKEYIIKKYLSTVLRYDKISFILGYISFVSHPRVKPLHAQGDFGVDNSVANDDLYPFLVIDLPKQVFGNAHYLLVSERDEDVVLFKSDYHNKQQFLNDLRDVVLGQSESTGRRRMSTAAPKQHLLTHLQAWVGKNVHKDIDQFKSVSPQQDEQPNDLDEEAAIEAETAANPPAGFKPMLSDNILSYLGGVLDKRIGVIAQDRGMIEYVVNYAQRVVDFQKSNKTYNISFDEVDPDLDLSNPLYIPLPMKALNLPKHLAPSPTSMHPPPPKLSSTRDALLSKTSYFTKLTECLVHLALLIEKHSEFFKKNQNNLLLVDEKDAQKQYNLSPQDCQEIHFLLSLGASLHKILDGTTLDFNPPKKLAAHKPSLLYFKSADFSFGVENASTSVLRMLLFLYEIFHKRKTVLIFDSIDAGFDASVKMSIRDWVSFAATNPNLNKSIMLVTNSPQLVSETVFRYIFYLRSMKTKHGKKKTLLKSFYFFLNDQVSSKSRKMIQQMLCSPNVLPMYFSKNAIMVEGEDDWRLIAALSHELTFNGLRLGPLRQKKDETDKTKAEDSSDETKSENSEESSGITEVSEFNDSNEYIGEEVSELSEQLQLEEQDMANFNHAHEAEQNLTVQVSSNSGLGLEITIDTSNAKSPMSISPKEPIEAKEIQKDMKPKTKRVRRRAYDDLCIIQMGGKANSKHLVKMALFLGIPFKVMFDFDALIPNLSVNPQDNWDNRKTQSSAFHLIHHLMKKPYKEFSPYTAPLVPDTPEKINNLMLFCKKNGIFSWKQDLEGMILDGLLNFCEQNEVHVVKALQMEANSSKSHKQSRNYSKQHENTPTSPVPQSPVGFGETSPQIPPSPVHPSELSNDWSASLRTVASHLFYENESPSPVPGAELSNFTSQEPNEDAFSEDEMNTILSGPRSMIQIIMKHLEAKNKLKRKQEKEMNEPQPQIQPQQQPVQHVQTKDFLLSETERDEDRIQSGQEDKKLAKDLLTHPALKEIIEMAKNPEKQSLAVLKEKFQEMFHSNDFFHEMTKRFVNPKPSEVGEEELMRVLRKSLKKCWNRTDFNEMCFLVQVLSKYSQEFLEMAFFVYQNKER